MSKKIDGKFLECATIFDMSMREFEIFLSESEKFFKERQKKLKYENEYYDDLNEKFLFYKWFPNIQRRSFIVSLVSIFEKEAKLYCTILNEYKKVKIKFSDLHGSAIEKFINYTINLAEINYEIEQKVFDDIKSLIEVRNCIVHSDGNIKNYDKKSVIKKFAKTFDGITFENDQIFISYKFCQAALKLISDFFNDVYKGGVYRYENDGKNCKTNKFKLTNFSLYIVRIMS